MTPEYFFVVHGNLRSIWRFFLSAVMVFLAYTAAYLVARQVRDFRPQGAWYELFFLSELLLLLGAFKVMSRLFENKPLAAVGLAFYPGWAKEWCFGLGVGAVMIISVGGAEALLGLARFFQSPFPAKAELVYGSGLAVVLLTAATNEELVFRGYPFQRLVESFGPAGAVVVSSALFGMAHLGNPHHTLISTANTMLVGVPLSIAYLRTRSLWMPVGIHFMWNYAQGFLFGLPVSGFTFPTTLLIPQVHDRAWLTGSGYGPEGGLLCTLVVVGAGIYLFWSPHIKISDRMRELVYGPSSDAATTAAADAAPGLGIKDDGPA